MTDTPDHPDFDSTEDLAALFHRASRLLARSNHRHARAQHAQARAFGLIKAHGPIVQADLLRLLDVRSSSLSEVLRKLEHSGLIVRTRNQEDRRGFVLSVNEGATPPFIASPEPSKDEAGVLFGCLDDEERRQMTRILTKIISAVGSDGPVDACDEAQRFQYSKGGRHRGSSGGRSKGRLRGPRRR